MKIRELYLKLNSTFGDITPKDCQRLIKIQCMYFYSYHDFYNICKNKTILTSRMIPPHHASLPYRRVSLMSLATWSRCRDATNRPRPLEGAIYVL